MQIITSTTNSQAEDNRPNLQIRNTWRGFEYSLDGNWIKCGYDNLELYVLYFDSQPTIVTLTEETIGTAADMAKKFVYTVTVTETVTTYTRTDRFTRSGGGYYGYTYTLAETGTPTQSGTPSSNTTSLPNANLSDGEQQAYTLFYIQSPDELTHDIYSTTSGYGYGATTYYWKDYQYKITTQTITITQSNYTSENFSTVNDGTGGDQVYVYNYTTSENSTDQSVTYTNTHTPLTVEVHLGIIGANGTITKSDEQRLSAASPYTLTLELGKEKTFLNEIGRDALYEAPGYGFAGVYYGTESGDVITPVAAANTVTYGQVTEPNIYELYFNDNASELKDTYHVYYLYYPLPKLVYVKETSGGALTRIQGSTDGTTVTEAVTYNGAVQTLNGVTVAQEQLLSVSTDLFTISQSGSGAFGMLPLLDDGTDKLYLRYAKIGVAGMDNVSATSSLDIVTEDKLLYLQVIDNQLKWSLDNAVWNSFTGTVPTIYAIYTEIGHDLEITKTVVNDGENPPKEFTVTISSNLITNSSYEVDGTGYSTINATPVTADTQGTILLAVKHGSIIKVKGLPKGSYTVTERDNENYTLTAKIGETDQTITDNSLTVDLSVDRTIDLTNTRKYAEVTISKTLIDPIQNRGTFSFAGTLMDGTRDITSLISGLNSFTITANTSAGTNTYTGTTHFNLPVSAELTVTEIMTTEQAELYEGTVTPETGSLTINETAENNVLSFTNTRKSAKLTITKNVTGDMGDRSAANAFTFTLVSVADEVPGTNYAWTKTTADHTTSSGTLTTNSASNAFTLAHGDSIEIELPLNKAIEITETNGQYRPTWSTNDSTVTLANTDTATVTATLSNDASVTIENNLPAVAPTGIGFRLIPYLSMLAMGLLLCPAVIRRKRKEED